MGPTIILLFLMLGVLVAVVGHDMYAAVTEGGKALGMFDHNRERARVPARVVARSLASNPVLHISRPQKSMFAPTPTPVSDGTLRDLLRAL